MSHNAFLSRLATLGVSVNELCSMIGAPDDSRVVGYTSHIDGFGTEQSDLDIYVCSDDGSQSYVRTYAVGDIMADVEFKPLAQIKALISTVDLCKLDDPEAEQTIPNMGTVKLLYRLAVGFELKSSPTTPSFASLISLKRLADIHARLNRLAVDDAAEDTLRHYQVGDYVSAAYMGRRAFDHSVWAYLANQGVLIFKPKWLYPAVRQHLGSEHFLYKAFVKYHFGVAPETAKEMTEGMIRDWEKVIREIS